MESFDLNDIEKPYQIVTERQDSFNQQVKNMSSVTMDKLLHLLSKAKSAVNDNEYFKQSCCVICQNLAHDHVICSGCDNAVMCRSCKDDWQKQKAGQFSCPICLSTQLPRNPTRFEKQYMDNIQVICPVSECKNKDQPMPLTKYKEHKCSDIFGPKECPQLCGQIINYLDYDHSHYQECKNSVVCCIICSSMVKKNQINEKKYSQLVEKIQTQTKDQYFNIYRNKSINEIENEMNQQQKQDDIEPEFESDQDKIIYQQKMIEDLKNELAQNKKNFLIELKIEKEKYMKVELENQQLKNELSDLVIQKKNEIEENQDEINILEFQNKQLQNEIEEMKKEKKDQIHISKKFNQSIKNRNYMEKDQDQEFQNQNNYFQGNQNSSQQKNQRQEYIKKQYPNSFVKNDQQTSIQQMGQQLTQSEEIKQFVSDKKKQHIQNILNQDPQISQEASQKFKKQGPLNIDDINGKLFDVWFHSDDLIVQKLDQIEIKGSKGIYNYFGMVHKRKNLPYGFGRAIRTDRFGFIDGQFLDGKRHGRSRWISQKGDLNDQEWIEGEIKKNIQKY